jgi:hypothetical protein
VLRWGEEGGEDCMCVFWLDEALNVCVCVGLGGGPEAQNLRSLCVCVCMYAKKGCVLEAMGVHLHQQASCMHMCAPVALLLLLRVCACCHAAVSLWSACESYSSESESDGSDWSDHEMYSMEFVSIPEPDWITRDWRMRLWNARCACGG